MRLFGFEDQMRTRLREPEVAALREAASRALAGQSDEQVARWLAEAGFAGTGGAPFSRMTVGRLLRNPAIAGLREAEDGGLEETGGPAPLTPEEFDQLQKRPGRRRGTERQPAAEYPWGGGLSVCGLCAAPLTGGMSDAKARTYRCTATGCGKTRIDADLFEDHIGEHVLAELSKRNVVARLTSVREQIAEEVRVAKVRMSELEESRADLADPSGGHVSRRALSAADRRVTDEIRSLRSRVRYLEPVSAAPVGGLERLDDLIQWWSSAPAASRRSLTALLFERIELFPARERGVRTIEPGRVVFHPRAKGPGRR